MDVCSSVITWRLLVFVVAVPLMARAKLTSEYVSHSPHHLLLTCSPSGLSPGTDVITIAISNSTTSSQHSEGDDKLAWMKTSDGVPKFADESGQHGRQLFVSGGWGKSERQLKVLVMKFNASRPASFSCRITYHGDQADIQSRDYRLQVHVHSDAKEEIQEPLAADKVPVTLAPKLTTQSPAVSEEDTAIRTGNVIQPTVLETGTPMSVVIAMLVLITLLFVVTSILLLQKFKEKCGTQHSIPYPGHYTVAREGLDGWGDHMGGLKGSPSLHTMVGLRSHYSLPRPLQPPPPPPKLLRSRSRESGDYAGSPGPIPPGMTRSYHYTTPYDAIVHDEDGELSLLNTSSHCDVTPALPPEQAAEPTYKVPRVEAGAQTQGQSHSMYVCGVPNGAPSFELE